MPTDTPACGFLGELCPEIETGNMAGLNTYKMDCFATTLSYIKSAYSSLRSLLCHPTNQFAQKFKFLANFITYFVNTYNIC